MSLKDAILGAGDRAREAVDVSEFWPEVGTVYVSVMSGWDRSTYEWRSQSAYKGKGDFMTPLVVRCVTDADGNRIFEDDDEALLAKKNWKALDKLWDAARRVNGIGTENQKELAKN